MDIRVRNLHKSFGRMPILNGLNMEFAAQTVNVIIGPNGAGKTTLLRLIGLLERPSAGEIDYDGEGFVGLGKTERIRLRRRIGYVFQNPLLLAGTVWDNLVYGLKIRRRPIHDEIMADVLDRVGLAAKKKSPASELSGGEKQRLQLARVLLLQPDLFLLDEPTANLDPLSSRSIEDLIAEISRTGKTVIMTTHNLLQARTLADRLFFLEQGRLIQSGSAAEIFSRPDSLAVAEFSAMENVFSGELRVRDQAFRLISGGVGIAVLPSGFLGPARGMVRAEDILVSRRPLSSSAQNSLPGKIVSLAEMGPVFAVTAKVRSLSLTSFITRESCRSLQLKPGQEIFLTFKATAVHVLPLVETNGQRQANH